MRMKKISWYIWEIETELSLLLRWKKVMVNLSVRYKEVAKEAWERKLLGDGETEGEIVID